VDLQNGDEGNVDPYDLNLRDLLDYLERLELFDSLLKKVEYETKMAQKRQQTKNTRLMMQE
jgi:hypothetical protein